EPAERRDLPRPVGLDPGALPGADPVPAAGARCAARARRVHRPVPACAAAPPPPPLAPPSPPHPSPHPTTALKRFRRYFLRGVVLPGIALAQEVPPASGGSVLGVHLRARHHLPISSRGFACDNRRSEIEHLGQQRAGMLAGLGIGD